MSSFLLVLLLTVLLHVLFVDDYVWTSLQVGNLDEKNTEKIQGGTTFEESISLLIYDLANDKVSSGRQLQLPFFFLCSRPLLFFR